MSGREILTTFEAASLCKVSYNTIKNWIKRGLLPAYRTAGGHLRIKYNDLQVFSRQFAVPIHDKQDPKKRNVLIIDSAEDFVNLFMDAFAHYREKLSVNLISDPFEAGLYVATNRPDVIFMGSEIAGLDIVKSCARIRRFIPSHETKLVLLLSDADVLAELAEKSGADLLIPLPVDKAKLFASVESFLSVKTGIRAGKKKK